MKSRSTFKLVALLLILALFVTACERPLSNDNGDDAATVDEDAATDENTDEVDEAADADVEADTTADDGAAAETDAAADTDETMDGAGSEAEAPEPEDTGGSTDQPAADDTGQEDENAGGGTPDAAQDDDSTADSEADEAATDDAQADSTDETEAADTDDEMTTGADDDTATEEPAADVPAPPEAAGSGGEEPSQSPTPPMVPATHTVAPGENLFRIGLKYNLSWIVLARYNQLRNPHVVFVGQILRIPGGAPPMAAGPMGGQPQMPPQGSDQPLEETSYMVRPGDNLFRIGLMFNVNWTQIAEANGIMNPNQIYAGQVLKIPSDMPGPKPQFTHVVRPGDTLFSIGMYYGMDWIVIAEANQVMPPYFVIYVGQVLVIPGE